MTVANTSACLSATKCVQDHYVWLSAYADAQTRLAGAKAVSDMLCKSI